MQSDNQVFWDFSVSTYYGEGVQEAFLDLQNERGADINLLLFCIWSGKTHGEFSDALFDSACAFSNLWASKVVIPLRNVRAWMKLTGCPDTGVSVDDCMNLRDKVKGAEFGAEKIQEEMLESMCAGLSDANYGIEDQVTHTVSNLLRYFDYCNIEADQWAAERLTTILRAAIPGVTEEQLTGVLGGNR